MKNCICHFRYIKNACRYNNVKIDLSKCVLDSKESDMEYKSRTLIDVLRSRVAFFHLSLQCYVMSVCFFSINCYEIDKGTGRDSGFQF